MGAVNISNEKIVLLLLIVLGIPLILSRAFNINGWMIIGLEYVAYIIYSSISHLVKENKKAGKWYFDKDETPIIWVFAAWVILLVLGCIIGPYITEKHFSISALAYPFVFFLLLLYWIIQSFRKQKV